MKIPSNQVASRSKAKRKSTGPLQRTVRGSAWGRDAQPLRNGRRGEGSKAKRTESRRSHVGKAWLCQVLAT